MFTEFLNISELNSYFWNLEKHPLFYYVTENSAEIQ